MEPNEHHVTEWRLNRLIETYGGNSKELRNALLELKQRRAEEKFNTAMDTIDKEGEQCKTS